MSDFANKAYRAFDYGEWEARQVSSVEVHYSSGGKPDDKVINNEKPNHRAEPDRPEGPIQHEDYEPNGPDGKAHTGVSQNENGDDVNDGRSPDPIHLKPVNFNMQEALLMAQVPGYTSTKPAPQPSKMDPRNKDTYNKDHLNNKDTSDGGPNQPLTGDDGKL